RLHVLRLIVSDAAPLVPVVSLLTNLTELWIEGTRSKKTLVEHSLPPATLTSLNSLHLKIDMPCKGFSCTPLPKLYDRELASANWYGDEPDAFRRLAQYTTLRELRLEATSTDTPLAMLAHMPQLHTMYLRCSIPEGETLTELKRLCAERGTYLR